MPLTKIRGDKQIIDGTITNTQISPSAAIAFAKLAAPLSDFDFGGQNLTNLAEPVNPTDAATKSYTDTQIASRQPLIGFPLNVSGGYDCTLSYNSGTRQLTVSPVSASFVVWTKGVARTFGTVVFSAHPNATGGYFCYFDETGTAITSASGWDLTKHSPVCYIFYNATLGVGIPFEERHTAWRDPAWHLRIHEVDGTQVVSGFALSGYTLQSDAVADVQFAIASGVLADEDLRITTQALADGGPYTIFERAGASGIWTWTTANTLPYIFGANRPYANTFTGGVWTRTEMANGDFLNYWLFAVPSLASTYQLILIPGQVIHPNIAAAQAESVVSIAWGSIPFQEIAPIARITLRTAAGYSATTKKARIEQVDRIFGSKASITTSVSPSSHSSLSGRSDADSHPATAISFAPFATLSSTNVQAAIEEMLTEMGLPEEDMTYSKRIDFVGDDVIYKGEAATGTLESAAVWRIRKITIGVDEDVTELWADGNSAFDNVWDDRLTLSYS